jgi:hypothetical protein
MHAALPQVFWPDMQLMVLQVVSSTDAGDAGVDVELQPKGTKASAKGRRMTQTIGTFMFVTPGVC